MSDYTNYSHSDLGDARPGLDPDFSENHLDDPRINDLDLPNLMVTIPPEWELDLERLSDEK